MNSEAVTDTEVPNAERVETIVVGAGVAGLSAAQALQASGADVLVLEKSRGLGGRSATRTLRGNRVDHGAQYFTVRDEAFRAQVEVWLTAGDLQVWSQGFHTFGADGLHALEPGHPRYVFPDGMNTFGKLLAEGLEVRRETRVTSLKPSGDGWQLEAGTGTFKAQRVILNMPPEQALALCDFDLDREIREALESVVLQPCFSLMAGFEADLKPEWQGVKLSGGNPVAWIAHDSSKRAAPKDTVLVAHSTPEFARENYTLPLEEVTSQLLGGLADVDERFATPLWTDLQRWRYAMATQFVDKSYLQQGSLLFCGDWCGGNKLEDAYLSGLAAARALSK
ncbi:FAD-dependent oxidoreductase [soil metagenome]